jgi:hypothetical protein
MVYVYALVQQVTSGRVVALRHEQEATALKALRPDMMQAWMFYEDYEGKYPAQVLFVIYNTGIMVRGPGIHEVPGHIVDMVRPRMLLEMAA